MAERLRFSVVIAAYNAAGTVARAVRSCLQQTYLPHEVIVVDDGSTDGTVPVLEKEFGGSSIRIMKLPRNAGPSSARNHGMDAANGDYIAFLDADDFWLPEKLAQVSNSVQNQPGIRFLFHGYGLSAAAAPLLAPPIRRYPLWKLLLRNPVATPCAVIIRDMPLRFDVRLRRMEDWDFFLRAAERYGMWHLPATLTVLGRPVLSPGGLSSSRRQMRIGEMRVYLKWGRSRPRYWLVLPFLLLWSLAKAVWKSVAG